MNEAAKAQYIVDTGEFGAKPGSAIYLVARYYRQIRGMKAKDIINSIHNIMEQTYPGYVRSNWEGVIESAAKQSNKRPLVVLDKIPVTSNELDVVNVLPSIKERRLAFTMIVIAKYYNAIHTENNSWVNLDPKHVFNIACVNVTKPEQAKMYAKLTQTGIITYSHKTGSVNARVLCVDSGGDPVLYVTDLRRVGNDYMMYCGKHYSVCLRCGITFRQSKQNNRKYCKDCEGWHPMVRRKFVCTDCGKDVFVVSRNTKSTRCPSCQAKEKQRRIALYRLRRNDLRDSENT